MIDKLINFFKSTILYFLIGATSSFIFTNIIMIQEGSIGTSCISYGCIGFIVSIFIAFMKKLIISPDFNWKNIGMILAGGILPILINAIGVMFNILSN